MVFVIDGVRAHSLQLIIIKRVLNELFYAFFQSFHVFWWFDGIVSLYLFDWSIYRDIISHVETSPNMLGTLCYTAGKFSSC